MFLESTRSRTLADLNRWKGEQAKQDKSFNKIENQSSFVQQAAIIGICRISEAREKRRGVQKVPKLCFEKCPVLFFEKSRRRVYPNAEIADHFNYRMISHNALYGTLASQSGHRADATLTVD